jgi:hypothetical protein
LIQRDFVLGGDRQQTQERTTLGLDVAEVPGDGHQQGEQRDDGQHQRDAGNQQNRAANRQDPAGHQQQPPDGIPRSRGPRTVRQFDGPEHREADNQRSQVAQPVIRVHPRFST